MAYAVINTDNHKEQNTKTTVEPAPTNKVNTNTPATATDNTAPSNPSPSTKTTQSPSAPAPSSDPSYNPYDTNGSPKDIYGCVLPPANVGNLKLEEIYQSLYAGCISINKPSWCLTQANNASNVYGTATRQAETIYDDAKTKDEATIRQGQALGGLAGQQMVSSGNSALANDQTIYRTAYDAAYNIYSDAVLSSDQQGNCNNSIPKYQAPAY